MNFNEGKACDAVLRVLEARENETRRDLRSPERQGHAAPIELTCWIGDRLFALEHTGIEPFARYVKSEVEAEKHFQPIEHMVSSKLPASDVFELHVPVKALQGLKGNEVRQIQVAISKWILARAPLLPAAPYGRYITPIQKARLLGVPFDVLLHRYIPAVPTPIRFQIRHLVSDKLENDRENRVREAYRKKIPKLDVWRRNDGARTVLVLEDNDLQLTNAELVFQALRKIEPEFPHKPDEVYLVSAMIDSLWFVHALRVGDLEYYGLSEAHQCMTEFDPSTLSDLTGP